MACFTVYNVPTSFTHSDLMPWRFSVVIDEENKQEEKSSMALLEKTQAIYEAE